MNWRKAFPIVAFVLVVGLWTATPLVVPLVADRPHGPGEFGDLFGSVNALFSGLALAGLIYAILLQREELSLQRQELQLTRDELRAAAESQARSAASLADQLREMQVAREAEMASRQFEELNASWTLDARRRIFALSDSAELERDEAIRREVERFLNHLNNVGYLLAKDLLPRFPTLELFYITAVRCWSRVAPYVHEQRKTRGVYMHHLQWLVQASVEFWEKYHPDSPIAIRNPMTGDSSVLDREGLKRQLAEYQSTSLWYVAETNRGAGAART